MLASLSAIADGKPLSALEAESAFDLIMDGKADTAQIAAFIMGLRVRGESVDEIVGGAKALRKRALSLTAPEHAVDTCGTGGDGLGTYNISTAAAIVAAASGVPIAKHGNRSVSSKSGSADVLAALGYNLDMPHTKHEEALRRYCFSFLFAPKHHEAMKHAVSARQSLKLRTIFNLLGPLSNPAGAKRQLLGVYSPLWLEPMAEVLKALKAEHVWVVHGSDGLDELTVTGPSTVTEMKTGRLTSFEVTPESVGLKRHPIEALKGGDAGVNAAALQEVLDGKPSAYRDIVLLNAGAAIVVGGKASTLSDGVEQAKHAVDSGAALKNFEDYIAFTQTAEATAP